MMQTYCALYELAIRPAIFRRDAQTAHEAAIRWMQRWDASGSQLLSLLHRLTFAKNPVMVGSVKLNTPLILAAGWVKGQGFTSEEEALAAVRGGQNIIPGWRSMPALVGPVEFGSFTRWPRIGNLGRVLWRDEATHSTQNRIGLKNPGAEAAAEFLSTRKNLPPIFGINIAVSPGVNDADQEEQEILEAANAFTRRRVRPAWFTLNLSCPNTEDDPGGYQTGDRALRLCGAFKEAIGDVPLWVKLGPSLGDEQYCRLMHAFDHVGVAAVVATNTQAEPTPEDSSLVAGVGGGRLHGRAVEVAALLAQEKRTHNYQVDVIGCGGVEDGSTFLDYQQVGVGAVQYLTALIYRGPLAAALILDEAYHEQN